MILGGSTNAVLPPHRNGTHAVGIKLDIDDFQNVSDRTPFLADIKPSGKYVMEDVYKLGGIPSTPPARFPPPRAVYLNYLFLFLIDRNSGVPAQEQIDLTGNNMTVTGRTLGENLEQWTHKYGELDARQDVIRPLDKPIKSSGHIRYARIHLLPTAPPLTSSYHLPSYLCFK